MVYWAILFYQDYRSHAKKATDLPLLFLPAKGFLSQTLSFLMFNAIKILFLKFSKFRKPKALRLMSLMRLLVASNLALE